MPQKNRGSMNRKLERTQVKLLKAKKKLQRMQRELLTVKKRVQTAKMREKQRNQRKIRNLSRKIRRLRKKMDRRIRCRTDLSRNLRLSRRMDRLILKIQRLKMNNVGKKKFFGL